MSLCNIYSAYKSPYVCSFPHFSTGNSDHSDISMAAVVGRTEITMKKTGTPCTVPANPTAKLMFYFNCVCTCVEADDDSTIRRLRDYKNYSLSDTEEAQLMMICLAVSPDKLLGSIFFPVDESDLDGYGNDFFEINAVSTKVVVADSILIGGQQKKVKKIMMCKKSWLETNYIEPLRSLSDRRQRSQRAIRPARQRESDSCIIS